ncbi:MAG: RluA family pseudouridine synthase [Gemmatimonadetes bacterium]|nr:RluA family pseudouridine synthase [Gemmatimonadota bacterium]
MEPVLPPTRRFNTEETGRLDVLVARALSLSRNQAATLIAAGRVLVSGRTEKASFLAPLGTEVIVSVPVSEARELLPEDIAISVVFEDEEMLVVDKAAGMVVHPAPGNWTGTLVNALMGRGQALADGGGGDERAGLVHRLDKETSGLMIVAKTDRAHRILSKAISEKRIIRRYAALSWGHLTDDFISVDKAIARDPANRLRMAVKEAGRAAKTDFYRIARFMSTDLLRAHLHSGRTHQIRVHLSSIGHPVVGDDTYGGGGARRLVALPPKRQFLHAAWLRFSHPVTGVEVDLRSPLPADLRESLMTVSEMPELIAHPDPLEYLGFYRVEG